MKQILTIRRMSPEDFDEEVNIALADGWELVKRETLLIGKELSVLHIAELEKETPEEENTCKNCRFRHNDPADPPCDTCDEDADKWEPIPEETEKEKV